VLLFWCHSAHVLQLHWTNRVCQPANQQETNINRRNGLQRETTLGEIEALKSQQICLYWHKDRCSSVLFYKLFNASKLYSCWHWSNANATHELVRGHLNIWFIVINYTDQITPFCNATFAAKELIVPSLRDLRFSRRWRFKPKSSVLWYQRFEGSCCLRLQGEVHYRGDRKVLRNAGILPKHFAMSQPRRPRLEYNLHKILLGWYV
jgi:hypothetical protein